MVAAPLGAEERFLLVEAKLALQRTVVNLKEEGGCRIDLLRCVTWAKVGHGDLNLFVLGVIAFRGLGAFPSFSDWFSARSLTIEQVIRAWP